MRILLFGGSGQLGFEFIRRASDLNFEVVSPVLSELDIGSERQVIDFCERVKPTVVVNCAAYTAVDKAEEQVEEAYRANAKGAENVAKGAKRAACRLLHVSTDYVFDGTAKAPVTEEEPTSPLNVYGKSKLEGEQLVENVLAKDALIVRTSSLHGQHGENFVHTMLKLFREREEVKVVDDQWMSPTWAGWLAEVLLDLSRISAHGIVHACGNGVCSWFEFANEIHRLSAAAIGRIPPCRVTPTTVENFPRPARRPRYSAMNCDRLTKLLGRSPIRWQEGLELHLRDIGYTAEGAKS